jgi:hypothetical protein
MREIGRLVAIACAFCACKGQSGSSAKQGSGESAGETEKMEGEIPVTLGDCAPAGTPFVSGPEPQAGELVAPPGKLYATMADGGDVIAAYEANDNDIYAGIKSASPSGDVGTIGQGVVYGVKRPSTNTNHCGPGMEGKEVRTPSGGVGICGRYVPIPYVDLLQPTVKGDLDTLIVRRYIKRNIQKISYCYEKKLLADAKLSGTVVAKFEIAEDGTVSKSEASGVHAETSECVANVIKGIEFPKPKSGSVSVTYPFHMRLADEVDDEPLPKPETAKQKARREAIEAAQKADLGVFDRPKPSGAFASLTGQVPTSKPYTPGAASPLVELRISLVDCFRRQDKHYAAAVFDLAPGSILVHGIDHPAFARCLVELGPQVKVTTPVRCSATFGSADASTLPALDITADAITMNGKKVIEPAAVAGTSSQWWRIDAVAKVAHDHVETTLASKDPLTLHGPLAVRPLPATPMKIVTKLVHTLISAGEDPVLAAQRNGTWQLVRNYPLPVVPVPTGTGGSWDSEASVFADPEPKPKLSVLVDANDVWVGASIVNKGKRMPFAELKQYLTDAKASKDFADREDIQIAGTDEVPYSRVVEAIDIANGAGFRRWSLTSPIGLAAQPR